MMPSMIRAFECGEDRRVLVIPGLVGQHRNAEITPHATRQLPALAAGLSLERPHDIVGDPAAVVAAGLRLDGLAVKCALVDAARIEGDIVRYGFVAVSGPRIAPGCVLGLSILD